MSANLLDTYKKFDPKVIECFENIQRSAFSEGALPQKVKTLIAMAIDAEHDLYRVQPLWVKERLSSELPETRF